MRHEVNRVFADDDRHGGERAARRDPIAPADDESSVVTERVANEDVLPTGFRHEGPELRQCVGAEKCIDAADDPDGEKWPERRQMRGDLARRPENAGADRVADDHRQTKGQAENTQETSPCRTQHATQCKGLRT